MGFEVVTNTAINLTKYQPNQAIVAYFIGTDTVKSQYGDQKIHKFMKESGERKNIYGFGSLNYNLSGITPGTLVRITYLGKSKLENGKFKGNPFHDCKVEADYSRTLEDHKLASLGQTEPELVGADAMDSDPVGGGDLPF